MDVVSCLFLMCCTCSIFFKSTHSRRMQMNRGLEKAWAPRVTSCLRGCAIFGWLFMNSCGVKTLQIIICHESLLLHRGLSCSSVLSLTTFQPSHPCLWQGMWIHGLHLCLITTTDGSVTDVSFSVCDGSHCLFPYSYCQHAFTSSLCGPYSPLRRCSSHCTPFTWCLQLCFCCHPVYHTILQYTG